MKIKAVIFDMDGLMYDTERIIKEGWQEAGRELGFTMTEEHFSHLRGCTRDYCEACFNKWFPGIASYAEGRAIRLRYQKEYIEKYGVPVKEGLMELLKALKERNIPAAIATSTSRNDASVYWEKTGVTEYFQDTVCGDEVVHGKPDPEIFLTAAKKLQTPPKQCLILEDSHNGIRAGRAAGAITCMVPDLSPVTDEIRPYCDLICENLSEVISYLDSCD